MPAIESIQSIRDPVHRPIHRRRRQADRSDGLERHGRSPRRNAQAVSATLPRVRPLAVRGVGPTHRAPARREWKIAKM